jgi:hypothetical protein
LVRGTVGTWAHRCCPDPRDDHRRDVRTITLVSGAVLVPACSPAKTNTPRRPRYRQMSFAIHSVGNRRPMAVASRSINTVFAVAGVECIACRDVAILADGNAFTCRCGQSRAWCSGDEVELLGPCFAWMRSAHGAIRRRPVQPLL